MEPDQTEEQLRERIETLEAENNQLEATNEQLQHRIETLEAETEQPHQQPDSKTTKRRLLRTGAVGLFSLPVIGSASAQTVYPVETDPRFDKIRTKILQFYLRSDAPATPANPGRAVMWVEDGDLP